MDVLVVGNGGREQALATKLADSSEVDNIYITQGNAGTEFIPRAENIDIPPLEIDRLAKFALQNQIGLTVVGPDDPLAHGIVDEFEDRGLTIFGPTKEQARVEWDREYAKHIDVPMGAYAHFSNPDDVVKHALLKERVWPLFIKDNYLARGKGANRCATTSDVEAHVEKLTQSGFFGKNRSLIVEDYVPGEEGSHHAFCDGKNYLSIPFIVRDHKTLYAGNTGPMTGGMGVAGPIDIYTPQDVERLGDTFVAPLVATTGFRGMLFSGLKGDKGSEKNLEWNARFGDPEAQVLMRLLKSDLLPILMACIEGTLDSLPSPEWYRDKHVVCLVMAASGYPDDSRLGGFIEGLNEAKQFEEVNIIHAGTKKEEGQIKVAGGRVLNIIAEAKDLEEAIKNAYTAAETISSNPQLYIRRDIGHTALQGI